MTITDLPIIQQGMVLFMSQIGFIYFRTLNVYFNSKLDRIGVFWTGVIVHIFWLISIAIGVTAIVKGNYFLVLFSLSGGLLGADRALRSKTPIKANN